MTVKDLKQFLNDYHDDDTVLVPFERAGELIHDHPDVIVIKYELEKDGEDMTAIVLYPSSAGLYDMEDETDFNLN